MRKFLLIIIGLLCLDVQYGVAGTCQPVKDGKNYYCNTCRNMNYSADLGDNTYIYCGSQVYGTHGEKAASCDFGTIVKVKDHLLKCENKTANIGFGRLLDYSLVNKECASISSFTEPPIEVCKNRGDCIGKRNWWLYYKYADEHKIRILEYCAVSTEKKNCLEAGNKWEQGKCETVQQEPEQVEEEAPEQNEAAVQQLQVINTCDYNAVDLNDTIFKLPTYVRKQPNASYQVASCNLVGGPIPQELRSKYTTTPWKTCKTGDIIFHKSDLWENFDALYYCDDGGWKIVNNNDVLKECSSGEYTGYKSFKVEGGTCYYKLNEDNITVEIDSINCCKDDQCPVGTKNDRGYSFCQSDADCTGAALPEHANKGQCKRVSTKTDCKICVATQCEPGYEVATKGGEYQGWCTTFTISGTIYDTDTSTKLTSAVTIKYTKAGTATTKDVTGGGFKNLWVDRNETVTFSAAGYEDQTCIAEQAESCTEIIMKKSKVEEEVVAQPDGTMLTIDGKIYDSKDIENPLTTEVTIVYNDGDAEKPVPATNGVFTLTVKKGTEMKFSAESYEDASCTPTETSDCTKIIMTTTNEPVVPETPDTDQEKIKKAEEAEAKYKAAAEKEKAGRAHSAIATGLSTAGGYMLGEAIAERRADRAAEADMKNYLAGMRCSYAGGQNVELGQTVEIPGGDELFNYYNKYKQIAERLKRTKAALNLPAGIESQVVYDKAETNLYKYTTLGARSGGEISLARALTNPNSEDAAAWAAQKEKTNTNMTIGGGLATGGLATGIIGRIAVNNKYDDDDDESED